MHARSRQAGRGRGVVPPSLSIIGAWPLAYFFKGALIRGPSAIWRAAHLNFTSEGLGMMGALPAACLTACEVLPLPCPPCPPCPRCDHRPRPHQGQFVNRIAFVPSDFLPAKADKDKTSKMQVLVRLLGRGKRKKHVYKCN